ncbi:glycerophosphodiester phosphodiesterase [Microbulbifer variabilis]|uniref:glycerophosphodiester phosphodiesterase n=1 Tax=Microbulbifer variabilis TaxID=266805 RepID=UPI001CFCE1F6|nr:glycerophosphodiester phosphodiesterase [Microbulbifer variabilis]
MLLLFCVLLLVLFFYARSGVAPESALKLPARKGPLVIAHGNDCGNGLFPGNTQAYLQYMVEQEVDAIEIDLWLTADGHLVLRHDPNLEDSTDGSGFIEDCTLAQLRNLNAAYLWSRDGETYPYRDKPLRIVTLEEALQLAGSTPLILDIKSEQLRAAHILNDVLEHSGKKSQVIVSSFNQRVIQEFRRLSPDTATGSTSWEAGLLFFAQLLRAERLLAPRYQTMQLSMYFWGLDVVTRGTLRAAHKLNLHLSVWTVNGRADLQRYIALGVDGIVTDRPDLLMAMLPGRGSKKRPKLLEQAS